MSICLFFIAHRRLKKKQPSYIPVAWCLSVVLSSEEQCQSSANSYSIDINSLLHIQKSWLFSSCNGQVFNCADVKRLMNSLMKM